MISSTAGIIDQAGFWGKPTSSVDWCEPNYLHSNYIAETFNTISNLFYVMFATLFFVHMKRFNHKMFGEVIIINSNNNNNNNNNSGIHRPMLRFYVMGLSVAMVGIGSWMFHMTLQVRDQMWDELSMHLPILTLLYSLWNHRDYVTYDEQNNNNSKNQKGVLFGFFLSWSHFVSFFAAASLFSFLYLVYNVHTPILFIATFFVEIMSSYVFSIKIANSTADNSSSCYEQHKVHKLQIMRYVFASFIFAFTVWNMDKVFCGTGIDALKLHSFWHLFTAYGCYLWGIFLSYSYYADKHDYLVSNRRLEDSQKGYTIVWIAYMLPIIQFDPKECQLKPSRS